MSEMPPKNPEHTELPTATYRRVENMKLTQKYQEVLPELPKFEQRLRTLVLENYPDVDAGAFKFIPEYQSLISSGMPADSKHVPDELQEMVRYQIDLFLDELGIPE